MKTKYFRFLLSFVLCGFCAFSANAASSIFSNYGQIQNVQNYSTNPFWTPSSPYNQRLPQPVYVQGADLTADDCFKVVQSLVSVQCMARDNCKETSLADIRPSIMVQLSNLPGANYVSACSGYIDGVYESYVSQFGNNAPNRQVAFPTATVPNQNLNNNNNNIQIKNPYEIKTPQWQQEINERTQELQELQQQNSADSEQLSATAFPETYADLSFTERMANARAGYEPFAGKSAYVFPEFQNENQFCPGNLNDPACKEYKQRLEAAQAAANADLSSPTSNLTGEQNSLVQEIVDFLNPQTQAEREFLTALVTAFVTAEEKDHSVVLTNEFVYNFLSENDNLSKYKAGLINLSGEVEDEEYKISLDWDEILIQISTVLDAAERRHGALVCENNRSYQISIDTVMWIGTAVAAIFSFGTAGAAAAAGKLAIGTGLKALAKGAAKVGLKVTGRSLARKGSKAIAAGAAKVGLKHISRNAGKAVAKRTLRRAAKQFGKNLISKKHMLLKTGAVTGMIYEIFGSNIAKSVSTPTKGSYGVQIAGTLLSLVDSEPSTEVIGCQDVDYGEGCYAVCGHDQATDDLNVKVFKPLLGKTYCVNEKDYTLYSMENGKPLVLTPEQYKKVKEKIRKDVVDQGEMQDKFKTLTNQKNGRHGCDWNEDDIDMYFGSFLYDPDTLEPSTSLIIEEFIRIDD